MPCGWCRVPQSLSAMRAHATVCSRRGVFETPPEGTTAVEVWLDEDRIGQFERAAKRENKSVSEWLRDLGAAAIAPPKDVDAFQDFGTQRGDKITIAGSYVENPEPHLLQAEPEQIDDRIKLLTQEEFENAARLYGPITVVAINQKPVQSEPDEMLKIRVIDPAPPRTEEGFDLIVTEELTREEFMERYSRTPEEQKDYLEHGCAVGLGFIRVEEVPEPEPEPNITQRKSAAEVARSIPGVRVGVPEPAKVTEYRDENGKLVGGSYQAKTFKASKIPEDW